MARLKKKLRLAQIMLQNLPNQKRAKYQEFEDPRYHDIGKIWPKAHGGADCQYQNVQILQSQDLTIYQLFCSWATSTSRKYVKISKYYRVLNFDASSILRRWGKRILVFILIKLV